MAENRAIQEQLSKCHMNSIGSTCNEPLFNGPNSVENNKLNNALHNSENHHDHQVCKVSKFALFSCAFWECVIAPLI